MSELKKQAAAKAVDEIKDGMAVGLGSGSTVNEFIRLLGDRVSDGLDIQCVPSSYKSESLAREADIPLIEMPGGRWLDITIDGADEVDGGLNLLKGGGGSLVREKIVAAASEKLLIMIDDSKRVGKLGNFALPVEVVPFGWQSTAERVALLGCEPALRKQKDEVFVSDNGNYILDCPFETIADPEELHRSLKQIVGVIETGLFVDMADRVFVAADSGVETLTKGRDGSL